MEQIEPGSHEAPAATQSAKLSYKFQRLREKIRAAIQSGEFDGKLPGERQLARRFRVNAKTLSKALTDLAAEGLLDRSIGRGTFVRNYASQPSTDRWLIVVDLDQASATIVELLRQANPNVQVITSVSDLRPSFLNQFKAVINFAWGTPDEFMRSLIVRNFHVVMVNREPTVFSMNAVLVDRALGISCLARDLMLSGHRSFLAIEKLGQTAVTEAIRRTAQRYAPNAIVDAADPSDIPSGVERGITSVLCGTLPLANEARRVLQRSEIICPQRVSLAAVGSGLGEYPCTGYYVHAEQKAAAIVQLLRDPQVKRPTTLWLSGAFVDMGTTAPIDAGSPQAATKVLQPSNPLCL